MFRRTFCKEGTHQLNSGAGVKTHHAKIKYGFPLRVDCPGSELRVRRRLLQIAPYRAIFTGAKNTVMGCFFRGSEGAQRRDPWASKLHG